MGPLASLPNLLPITLPGGAMAKPEHSREQPVDPWSFTSAQQRRHLELCWQADCDLDPMILRARQLRHQGSLPQASCVEQELLPLF